MFGVSLADEWPGAERTSSPVGPAAARRPGRYPQRGDLGVASPHTGVSCPLCGNWGGGRSSVLNAGSGAPPQSYRIRTWGLSPGSHIVGKLGSWFLCVKVGELATPLVAEKRPARSPTSVCA